MDFNTKINVYKHFLNIDESLQLSVEDHPNVDLEDIDNEFTYYDFIFKDYLNIRTTLHESGIANLDAHYILKKFLKARIDSENERSRGRSPERFTYNDHLNPTNEEEYIKDDIDYNLMHTIVEFIENPQYLFEFLSEFGTFNHNLKYQRYPYEHIENHGKIPYILASYISHLPLRFYSHIVNYDVTFKSYKEATEWQNNTYKILAKNGALDTFLRLKDLAQNFMCRIQTLDDINVDLGHDFYKMQKELSSRNEKLAFINSNQANIAPELIVAHYVWNFIYIANNNSNQNLSHSSKVQSALKTLKNIPEDQRFIDRIKAITTPKEHKSCNWDDFFK